MNSELTEKLFDVAHTVALDLAALNIQRGRDHGLQSYVKWRQYCGLGPPSPVTSFDDLAEAIPSRSLRSKLRRLYGHPENIDLWVGSLMERPVSGGRVGPTVQW